MQRACASKESACQKRPLEWQLATGLQTGRRAFSGNPPSRGGLRRVCGRPARRAPAKPSLGARQPCKAAPSRRGRSQTRRRPPFRAGKQLLGSFAFCKPVVARRLRPGSARPGRRVRRRDKGAFAPQAPKGRDSLFREVPPAYRGAEAPLRPLSCRPLLQSSQLEGAHEPGGAHHPP